MRLCRIRVQVASLLLLATLSVAAESPKLPIPGAKERCPVCGMFVTKYSKWLAATVTRDGSTAFFDGPKDMFRYYFSPEKYSKGRKKADIRELYVTEYYTARFTRAEDLYYVVGSDVLGPMGRELIPVKGTTQAEGFRVDHKGERVLKFPEITAGEISHIE